MDSFELKRLAKKYMDGNATEEEKQLLARWYDTIHDDDQLVIVNTTASEDDIKQRILRNIQKRIEAEEDTIHPDNRIRLRKMVTRIATIAAAILLITCFAWYFNRPQASLQQPAAQLLSVKADKIMRITLADGSGVWLNARSVFKYPRSFTGKARQVELVEGRAFFDIRHQDSHPFIVKTKDMNIIVLGTSFDVSTSQGRGVTRVSVISGKVGITMPGRADQPAVMLLPRQQVVLNAVSQKLTREITPDPVVNLWCKNPLVFDQEDLSNVFKAIEKQYNTHIEVENKKLLNERISITLGNQHLDTIMEILSFTKHFKYQMANDSTVVIK